MLLQFWSYIPKFPKLLCAANEPPSQTENLKTCTKGNDAKGKLAICSSFLVVLIVASLLNKMITNLSFPSFCCFGASTSAVKLSIRTFKVPELFIEMPEIATVGSLKVSFSPLYGCIHTLFVKHSHHLKREQRIHSLYSLTYLACC